MTTMTNTSPEARRIELFRELLGGLPDVTDGRIARVLDGDECLDRWKNQERAAEVRAAVDATWRIERDERAAADDAVVREVAAASAAWVRARARATRRGAQVTDNASAHELGLL